VTEDDWLAERFEEHRPRLRGVAYRMLGSLAEADDAVQEAWLRASRAGAGGVENLGGWLTTVVARVCLNMLRARRVRREEQMGVRLPDPIVGPDTGEGPEDEVVLADSVGLALQVVLETLTPAERLAFVLHDLFAVPFEEIAPMVDRSPEAARQLASRARRRVHGVAPAPDADRRQQRRVVDAFFAAARGGRLDELVALLHPDAVLRFDAGPARPEASTVVRGGALIASRASGAARTDVQVRPALVNGAAGAIIVAEGRPVAVWGFAVVAGRIAEIDVVADPGRLGQIDPAVVAG
jgi:RNA polymerase sigma-70 factor (ECF subfamily)